MSLRTESSAKQHQGNKPLTFQRAGPKSTKTQLPNLPEMISDEEAQKTARKSALLVAKLRDGSIKAEIMENIDDYGANTSKNMFGTTKADIEYVQVIQNVHYELAPFEELFNDMTSIFSLKTFYQDEDLLCISLQNCNIICISLFNKWLSCK